MAKSGVKTLMFRLAEELLDSRIATVTAVPGFLRTERMLEHFGVTEDNWREAGEKDPHFLQSETPRYLGRGLAALAEDESRIELTGDVLSSWELARRYDVTDIDGSRPNWGPYFAGIVPTLGWIHDGLRRQVAWLDGMAERGRDYLRQVT
jgi:NAD(P)-dependent dehydrogenase (short-subunit alcohol dehydrogenase family)